MHEKIAEKIERMLEIEVNKLELNTMKRIKGIVEILFEPIDSDLELHGDKTTPLSTITATNNSGIRIEDRMENIMNSTFGVVSESRINEQREGEGHSIDLEEGSVFEERKYIAHSHRRAYSSKGETISKINIHQRRGSNNMFQNYQ